MEAAVARALTMLDEGADIIDIGGESTRPGSNPVPIEHELARSIPVIEKIMEARPGTQISIDTRNSRVAQCALEAGASIVNDVSGLRHDDCMLEVLKQYSQARVIIMHMQGNPQTMQDNPQYNDVVMNVISFMQERIAFCESNGITADRLYLDPGIGFGKNLSHNLALLANLSRLTDIGIPVVLGASRKRFISEINPSDPDARLGGSLAAVFFAMRSGVEYVRVHDVKATKQFIDVVTAIWQGEV